MATDTIKTPGVSLAFEKGFQNSQETPESVNLTVKGKFPEWLEGELYRNGPGTFEVPKKDSDEIFKFQHWFDCSSQVHRFEIRDQVVSYRSRDTNTNDTKLIQEKGYLSDISFGQDLCENLFQKFFTTFQQITKSRNSRDIDPNTKNIGVTLTNTLPIPETVSLKNHRTLVSQTDANMLKQLDPVTLDPLRVFSFKHFDSRLIGELSPAHPQFDASTGEYISFTQKMGFKAAYTVFSIRTDPETGLPVTKIFATINARSVYIHSLSLTKKYIILILWQCDHAWSGLKTIWEKNLAHSFKSWNPEEKTLYYVIDRQQQKHVATYTSPTYFCFHTLNAWDDNEDDIVLDLGEHKDKTLITRYRLKNVSQNLASATVNDEKKLPMAERVFQVPQELNMELYNIDYSRYHLKKHRYTYGISGSLKPNSRFYDSLLKLDLNQNPDGTFSHKRWEQQACTPSEPIFVPAPNAVAEDEGVILSVILDGTRGTSFLLALDAETFEEIARAELSEGKVVPFGFHGLWNSEKRGLRA
ncbi:hypothetical protein G9A89_017549 [Geosiphon pyriformis]|nr:hypothetical protein G9A89_017549 [Geosiphon pyriformis]